MEKNEKGKGQDMPRRFGVTIDCRDPLTLAAFWREVLDYQDDPAPAGYASWAEYDAANGVSAVDATAGATIVDPSGAGPRIYLPGGERVLPGSVKPRSRCVSVNSGRQPEARPAGASPRIHSRTSVSTC